MSALSLVRWSATFLWALSAGACGWVSEPELCTTPDAGLDAHLSCERAFVLTGWIERVAGRPLPKPLFQRVLRGLKTVDERDVSGVITGLQAIDHATRELVDPPRLWERAQARSHALWRMGREEDPIPADWDGLRGVAKQHAAVWVHDDDDQLALSEADIEGWIAYASLCREVQGASPLRISISDRVRAYRIIEDRFEASAREGRVAMSLVGGNWSEVRKRWSRAPYTVQQAWIASAPLPPPMTADSIAYLEAVMGLDVKQTAHVLQDKLLEPASAPLP